MINWRKVVIRNQLPYHETADPSCSWGTTKEICEMKPNENLTPKIISIVRGMRSTFLATFLIVNSQNAFSHGGGEALSNEKPKKIVAESMGRAPKTSPSLLPFEDFLSVAQNHNAIPEDVLLVSCKLSTVNCRGIQVALLDTSGAKVLEANTGSSGFVGFQGLKPKDNYLVKIESEKYEGMSQVHPGKSWNLQGERRNQDSLKND